ncbi:GNAT family N-acetyltransferase [Methylobacillus flagellatus]|uniref:L-ornithine N(alpha)-acyltransferase n=1 Tax=Methylobacillus flagellatus (strain ATCC 51484 / DSM 6875 / VKM B-1610 / KT) TaxID=265072 RepID=Q1H448_METFK|nr:GNAT family N-acyltransferase [Methylobacillus flagellatus]ABE48739.1 ornithine-acyl[acyl carrier protein] N-acyltransferase [Methylobacillus flagellatus KT]
MLDRQSSLGTRPGVHQLYVSLARNASEIAEAQRLRYKVFAEEMGANVSGTEGLDQDGFDAFCDHLLVRNHETGEVVGTYRILSPAMANEAGGYYSAGEFDLSRLRHLAPSMVEVGRACVHKDYRLGGTITLLWAGLANYMKVHRYEYMIGCGSIGMADGGHMAASLYHQLKQDHLSPVEYRVFPNCPLPLEALRNDLEVACPPLIKGYLRLGAYICGAPAWDPDFNTADMLVMLPLSRLNKRYAAHFFK